LSITKVATMLALVSLIFSCKAVSSAYLLQIKIRQNLACECWLTSAGSRGA